MRDRALLVTVLLLAALVSACGPAVRDPQVSVGGGPIPEFTFKGSPKLTSFKVYGTVPGDDANKPAALLWEIEPQDPVNGPSLEDVRLIRFGSIPPGFTQRSPQKGPPDILAENVTYVGVVGIAGYPDVTMPVQVRYGKTVFVGPVMRHRNIPTH